MKTKNSNNLNYFRTSSHNTRHTYFPYSQLAIISLRSYSLLPKNSREVKKKLFLRSIGVFKIVRESSRFLQSSGEVRVGVFVKCRKVRLFLAKFRRKLGINKIKKVKN